MKWLKEQWEWFFAGIIAIIALAAAKKRDSGAKIKNNDLNVQSSTSKKITEQQSEVYEAHLNKREKAEKDFDKTVEKIAKDKELRKKELENNPEKLDKILKEKYGLKGE